MKANKTQWSNAIPEYDENGNLIMCGQLVATMSEKNSMFTWVDALFNRNNGSILEIGYGLGLSSERIAYHNPSQYTIIDLNKDIAQKAQNNHPTATVIQKDWRDCLDLGKFELIFMDTQPYENTAIPAYKEFAPLAYNFLSPNGHVAIACLSTEPRRQILNYLKQYFNRVSILIDKPRRDRYLGICFNPKGKKNV